jgi:hypothetical protein
MNTFLDSVGASITSAIASLRGNSKNEDMKLDLDSLPQNESISTSMPMASMKESWADMMCMYVLQTHDGSI